MNDMIVDRFIKVYDTAYTHDDLLHDRDIVIEACGFLRCLYFMADNPKQRNDIKTRYSQLSLVYLPFHNA